MLCQHDDLSVGRQKKENVPGPISWRMVGSWFIWLIWSVGLFGFFGLSGSENEPNQINQIDQTH